MRTGKKITLAFTVIFLLTLLSVGIYFFMKYLKASKNKEEPAEEEPIYEGPMCNFVRIDKVTDAQGNPADKDGDGNFDTDESVPCEQCSDYKLEIEGGTKVTMEPFVSNSIGYCIASRA
jgi:hypothetical protein